MYFKSWNHGDHADVLNSALNDKLRISTREKSSDINFSNSLGVGSEYEIYFYGLGFMDLILTQSVLCILCKKEDFFMGSSDDMLYKEKAHIYNDIPTPKHFDDNYMFFTPNKT